MAIYLQSPHWLTSHAGCYVGVAFYPKGGMGEISMMLSDVLRSDLKSNLECFSPSQYVTAQAISGTGALRLCGDFLVSLRLVILEKPVSPLHDNHP